MLKKWWPWLLIVLTIGNFARRASSTHDAFDPKWIAGVSCAVREKRDFRLADCNHPAHKAHLAALPWLGYKEGIRCSSDPADTDIHYLRVNPPNCEVADAWMRRGPEKSFDIGFDAYSVWYARAVALYFKPQREDWPGFSKAFFDSEFIRSFPCRVCPSYPWLVPWTFGQILRAFDTAHPFVLQLFQVLIWAVCAYLFWAIWPRAPRWLLALFAFSPVLGFLLFKLYADTWLLLGGLLMLLGLQRDRRWLIAAAAIFLVATKREGFLQVFVLLLTWILLQRTKFGSRAYWALGAGAFAFALYALHVKFVAPAVAGDMELGGQLGELRTYTYRIPRIFGYYLDVIFRLNHWIILWPVAFWNFWKGRKNLGWSLAPLLVYLILMPLGFLIYPENVYREVVLSGTFRPLVHVLPTVWLLLQHQLGSIHAQRLGTGPDSGLSSLGRSL